MTFCNYDFVGRETYGEFFDVEAPGYIYSVTNADARRLDDVGFGQGWPEDQLKWPLS